MKPQYMSSDESVIESESCEDSDKDNSVEWKKEANKNESNLA